ncbi:MAG: hypothetical protein OEX07_13365 [Gammaproteobacteria bacterium]|nr:hypothetical protein [Gammaproteobacteria bacterium]
MSELKESVIAGIIKIEGGFIDDPDDSGGATNYGITEEVARNNGYTGDMRDLPMQLVTDIYSGRYWDVLSLDDIEKLSVKITEELADTGVNMGVERAGTFLQRSLNVLNKDEKFYDDLKVDGQVGRMTIQALADYLAHRGNQGEVVLYRMLNALQGAFYVLLCERRVKDEKHIFGWFSNRVA